MQRCVVVSGSLVWKRDHIPAQLFFLLNCFGIFDSNYFRRSANDDTHLCWLVLDEHLLPDIKLILLSLLTVSAFH